MNQSCENRTRSLRPRDQEAGGQTKEGTWHINEQKHMRDGDKDGVVLSQGWD